MDQAEIQAAAAAFEAAAAQGEYFPQAWFDRLAVDDAYRILLARLRLRNSARYGRSIERRSGNVSDSSSNGRRRMGESAQSAHNGQLSDL